MPAGDPQLQTAGRLHGKIAGKHQMAMGGPVGQ